MKWCPIEVYQDLRQCTDSMLFSSETVIAQVSSKDKKYKAVLSVFGGVRVWYQGEVYHDVSEFPDSLKQLFMLGEAYDNDEVEIDASNCYNMELYENDELLVADIWEGIPADYLADELQEFLVAFAEDCIEYFGE